MTTMFILNVGEVFEVQGFDDYDYSYLDDVDNDLEDDEYDDDEFGNFGEEIVDLRSSEPKEESPNLPKEIKEAIPGKY